MVPNFWPILLKIKLYYLCIYFSFLSNDIVACLISLDFLKYMISRIWKKFTISIVKYSHVGSTDSLMCSDICNVGWNIIYPYSWWIFNLIKVLCFQDKSRQTEKGKKNVHNNVLWSMSRCSTFVVYPVYNDILAHTQMMLSTWDINF